MHITQSLQQHISHIHSTHISHMYPTHISYMYPTHILHMYPTHISHMYPTHISHMYPTHNCTLLSLCAIGATATTVTSHTGGAHHTITTATTVIGGSGTPSSQTSAQKRRPTASIEAETQTSCSNMKVRNTRPPLWLPLLPPPPFLFLQRGRSTIGFSKSPGQDVLSQTSELERKVVSKTCETQCPGHDFMSCSHRSVCSDVLAGIWLLHPILLLPNMFLVHPARSDTGLDHMSSVFHEYSWAN